MTSFIVPDFVKKRIITSIIDDDRGRGSLVSNFPRATKLEKTKQRRVLPRTRELDRENGNVTSREGLVGRPGSVRAPVQQPLRLSCIRQSDRGPPCPPRLAGWAPWEGCTGKLSASEVATTRLDHLDGRHVQRVQPARCFC